jgi:hypothetical protein
MLSEDRQDDELEIRGFKLSSARKLISAGQDAMPPMTRTMSSAMASMTGLDMSDDIS